MSNDVLFANQQHLGIITLSRPQALNSLNLSMIQAMQAQLLQWQEDEKIHAVVIQAEPGKAFCVGGDVRWLYETGLKKDPLQLQFFWHEYRLNHFISRMKKPYIALMDGITMGGGVGVSMHGSHPVATDRFIFAMPETGIGLFPDIGASYLLSRCSGALGVYLALTGNRLNAEEALSAGLVKNVITHDKIETFFSQLHSMDLSQGAAEKIDLLLKSLSTIQNVQILKDLAKINQHFSLSSVKEIVLSLQQSNDEWSIAMVDNLLKKSPLSLEVSFAQIQRAKSLSLAECLKMDYCLVKHFMAAKDFYEGIRAVLVDKDKNPHWLPASLAEVSSADVANYFECTLPELAFL